MICCLQTNWTSQRGGKSANNWQMGVLVKINRGQILKQNLMKYKFFLLFIFSSNLLMSWLIRLNCCCIMMKSALNWPLILIYHKDNNSQLRSALYKLWAVVSGGIKGGMGAFAPLSEVLPPTYSPQSEEIVKISHIWQIFGFLPPQKHILSPRCPHKKISGAATGCSAEILRGKHGK